MVEDNEQMNRDNEASRAASLQVFGTDADNPDDGRIFVWTIMGWFERIEGQSGDVAFTSIAHSESDLRELISRDDSSSSLTRLGGEYRKMVSKEFMEQSPLYQDSVEYSDEDPLEDDSQEYHQHD